MGLRLTLGLVALALSADLMVALQTGRTRLVLNANKNEQPTMFWPTILMGALSVIVFAWIAFEPEV